MKTLMTRKYHVNPETLRYERVKLPVWQRLRSGLILTLGLVALAVILRAGFERYYPTPRQLMYERENVQLRQDYVSLNYQLQSVETLLSEFRMRDDRLYRSILSLEPVPSSIRDAGTGGSEAYSYLNTIREPQMVMDVSQRIHDLKNKVDIQSSSLEKVYAEAINTQHFLASRPSINPISPADPYWMTSSYGYRLDPFTKRRTAHHGIDLAGPYGIPIHATGDGIVTTVHMSRYGYGKEVLVDHGYGFMSRYAHLQDILVKKGQKLKRGEVLGTMGNTGRSTGPHLHYEIVRGGHPVNPMYFFYENLDAREYGLLTANALKDRDTQGFAMSQK